MTRFRSLSYLVLLLVFLGSHFQVCICDDPPYNPYNVPPEASDYLTYLQDGGAYPVTDTPDPNDAYTEYPGGPIDTIYDTSNEDTEYTEYYSEEASDASMEELSSDESSLEDIPVDLPTDAPTEAPTDAPTEAPTDMPTVPTDTPHVTPPTIPDTPASSVHYGLRILLIGTTTDDVYYSSAKLTLDSVGALYDSVFGDTVPVLTRGDTGIYGGIVVATLYPISGSLLEALDNYQLVYGVRKVVLFTAPSAPAMEFLGTMGMATVSFKIPDSNAPHARGIQHSFVDSIGFCYVAKILDTQLAAPALTMKFIDSIETVAAAFIKHPDNRQDLEFYVPPAVGTSYSLVFGNLWLQWINGGMYVGLRRMIWSIQVDDLFLSTTLFDPATSSQSGPSYRSTFEDVVILEQVQKLINELVPGSNVTVEFAFNGAGVELGGGFTSDPLFIEFKLRKKTFMLESHTYTHPGLDTATYEETYNQLIANMDIPLKLYGTANSTSVYSSRAMITGLFNGEALRAMHDAGITYVVGDNSRPELVPANKYHGIHTTVEKHGYAGIFIVPRHVTDIYYDCSTPDEEVAQYNSIYSTNKSIREIVSLQAGYAGRMLLAFRHDPFMFHQANIRKFTLLGDKQLLNSLLSMWMAATLTQVTRYSSLPLWTYKHEDLADILLQREIRDSCEVDVQVQVEKQNQITGLTLVSGHDCRYAITGIDVVPTSNAETETYGPDHTVWIDLVAGIPTQLQLTTPIYL